MKNEMRNEEIIFVLLSCCFLVQCLEEFWHDNDVQ